LFNACVFCVTVRHVSFQISPLKNPKRYELLYRHFRTESKYVRITADALTAGNRHVLYGQRVRRVVQCVCIAANAARWLAGRLSRRV